MPIPWETPARLEAMADQALVTGRWTASRKVAICELVRRNLLTLEQACKRFDLSGEELRGWIARETVHGERGLRVTRLQEVGRHV